MRVLASLGNNEDKTVQYFLDGIRFFSNPPHHLVEASKSKSDQDDAQEKERKLQKQLSKFGTKHSYTPERIEEEKKKLEAAVGGKFPGYWEEQDENFKLYNIEQDSTEWQSVVDRYAPHTISQYFRFSQTAVGINVTALQRIQNKRLWRWYSMKKQDIADNNGGSANEKFLFHGSGVSIFLFLFSCTDLQHTSDRERGP